MYGGCYLCGGAHFVAWCPKVGKGHFGSLNDGVSGDQAWGQYDGIRSLCTLTEVKDETEDTKEENERVPLRTSSSTAASPVPSTVQEDKYSEAYRRGLRKQRHQKKTPSIRLGAIPYKNRYHILGEEHTPVTKLQDIDEDCKEEMITINQVGVLREVSPHGICAVGESEWEEIVMYVDSGATETVISDDMLMSVEKACGKKKGVEYETADGSLIPNLGEKQFFGVSSEGISRNLTAQVCLVNKALLSVRKVVRAGNRVVFDEDGSFIEDKNSGETIKLTEEGGMYALSMWVKRDGKSPF